MTSYLCKGCINNNCFERNQISNIFDKPQDCTNFRMKSMCFYCKKSCKNFEKFFICGAFKHEKGYYIFL
jgi:hypothetical protein